VDYAAARVHFDHKDKTENENLVADHLSRLGNEEITNQEGEIIE